jgi:SpoVK/Ycf46/Vps4 family AAA+-type ATPase
MKKQLLLLSLMFVGQISLADTDNVVKVDDLVEIQGLNNMVGPHKNFFALLINYYQLHGRFPSNNRMILAGPPGTGKTMYPEEIAKLLGCNYMKIRSSSVINKFVGAGPS